MKRAALISAVATCMLYPATTAAQQAEHIADPGPDEHLIYTVVDVEWRDGPASFESGARVAILEGNPAEAGVFTMRIRMPDGFRIAPHWHPSPERVTVLAGTFRLGSGDVFDAGATIALEAGSYTAMPPGMRHYAVADGETVIQLTSTGPWEITYVRSEDDPRTRKSEHR